MVPVIAPPPERKRNRRIRIIPTAVIVGPIAVGVVVVVGRRRIRDHVRTRGRRVAGCHGISGRRRRITGRGWCVRLCRHSSSGRRGSGSRRRGHVPPVVQHRGNHPVGYTLAMQVKDFPCIQAVDGSGILNEGDNRVIADLRPGQLQDLRNPIRQLDLWRHTGTGWRSRVGSGGWRSGVLCPGVHGACDQQTHPRKDGCRPQNKSAFHNIVARYT